MKACILGAYDTLLFYELASRSVRSLSVLSNRELDFQMLDWIWNNTYIGFLTSIFAYLSFKALACSIPFLQGTALQPLVCALSSVSEQGQSALH